MYNTIRQKVQALLENKDLAQQASEFTDVTPETDTAELKQAAQDVADYTEVLDDAPDEEVVEDFLFEAPEDRINVEGTFAGVAKRILRTQRNLGALKSLSVKTLTLEETRAKQLIKVGALSVASLTGAALLKAGIQYKKDAHLPAPTKQVFDATPVNVRVKQAGDSGLKTASAGVGVGIGLAVGNRLLQDRKDVVIVATYRYGSKMFKVWSLTADQEQAKLPARLLKAVTAEVKYQKQGVDWKVKEDASEDLQEHALLLSALVEDTLETLAKEVSDFQEVCPVCADPACAGTCEEN